MFYFHHNLSLEVEQVPLAMICWCGCCFMPQFCTLIYIYIIVQPLGCTYMLAGPDKGQLKMAGGPGKGPRKIFRPQQKISCGQLIRWTLYGLIRLEFKFFFKVQFNIFIIQVLIIIVIMIYFTELNVTFFFNQCSLFILAVW